MPMSSPRSVRYVRTIYGFIKANRGQYSVQLMCRVLEVAPSGYYAWLQQPLSNHAQADARLLRFPLRSLLCRPSPGRRIAMFLPRSQRLGYLERRVTRVHTLQVR